jgi:TldD protein
MKQLLKYAVDMAVSLGASYADARGVVETIETIYNQDRDVPYVDNAHVTSVGIRVIVKGGWGFASTPRHATKRNIQTTVANAIANAQASSKVLQNKVILVNEPAHVATWKAPIEQDPFKVPLTTKIALLHECAESSLKVRGIKITTGSLEFHRIRKYFVSSQGADIEQEYYISACGMDAYAYRDGQYQIRSYPTSFGGQYEQAGWEMVEKWDLAGNARRIAEEAIEVSHAPLCPTRTTNVILGGSQVALQVHESTMHPSELDRVFGEELNYAGGSFLSTDHYGRLKYGSSRVNVVADATIPGALGTFAFDDEGVAAQRFHIVKNGVFSGYLTSRETAHEFALARSGGAMRAASGSCMPLIRGTNVSLEPGRGSLEELIADTKEGVFLDTNKSWSIDDQRHNFQFGTEVAWEIKNGKRKRMLRDASYAGLTTKFWNSCDAICGPEERVYWGVPNCGKGQPCQSMMVGHGAQPARFRNVQVGVSSKLEAGESHGGCNRGHGSKHSTLRTLLNGSRQDKQRMLQSWRSGGTHV